MNSRRKTPNRCRGTELPDRINRAIELLAQGHAIYYTGAHTGAVLTRAQGRTDAGTWADNINIGMEHGAFDLAGLAEYMAGLVEAGPTRSGHRTPAVIVEAPARGTDESCVLHNAWQFRQILGRGVHGILLCQAESADAVRAFVESCRYPHQEAGVDPALPSPRMRMEGARGRPASGRLGTGTRGRGSEPSAAPIWGIDEQDYFRRSDPWPLNAEGELLLGSRSKARKALRIARRSAPSPASASPRSGRAISGLRSATRPCATILIRRKWRRRDRASSPPAAPPGSRSWKPVRPPTSASGSRRACASLPVAARRRRGSAAPTSAG